jgi:hypothetical protein
MGADVCELRRPLGKHESNDQLKLSLDRIMDVKVIVHYISPRTGLNWTPFAGPRGIRFKV